MRNFKILGLIMLMAFGMNVEAQMSKITTAKMHMDDGLLDKAKASVDEGIKDAKAAASAKSWLYMGQIYTRIAADPEGEYKDLIDGNTATTAYSCFKKVFTCGDPKKEKYFQKAAKGSYNVAYALNNAAIAAIQAKDSERGLELAKLAVEANKIGVKYGDDKNMVWDATSNYVLGLAQEANGDTESAKKTYQMLIEKKSKRSSIYSKLAMIQLADGDEDAALATLGEGRKRFPDDQDLVNSELQMYIQLGRQEEKLEEIQMSIDKDPEGEMVHIYQFLMGTACDKIKSDAEDAEDYEKADKYRTRAASAYESSLKAKPDYFPATLNLGALYFNHAGLIDTKISDIEDMVKFEAEKVRMNELFAKSRPYLEKAHNLDPKDKTGVNALMILYGKTGEYEKQKEMKAKLDALTK